MSHCEGHTPSLALPKLGLSSERLTRQLLLSLTVAGAPLCRVCRFVIDDFEAERSVAKLKFRIFQTRFAVPTPSILIPNGLDRPLLTSLRWVSVFTLIQAEKLTSQSDLYPRRNLKLSTVSTPGRSGCHIVDSLANEVARRSSARQHSGAKYASTKENPKLSFPFRRDRLRLSELFEASVSEIYQSH